MQEVFDKIDDSNKTLQDSSVDTAAYDLMSSAETVSQGPAVDVKAFGFSSLESTPEQTINDEDDSSSEMEVSPNASDFASSPISRHRNEPFPFLSLPIELRSMVYDLLMKYPGRVPIMVMQESGGDRTPYCERWCSFAPEILRVNKQISMEATRILYSNLFVLENTTELNFFLLKTGSNCKYIQRLWIRDWAFAGPHRSAAFSAFTLLAQAVRFGSIHTIYLPYKVFSAGTPRGQAWKFYDTTQELLKACKDCKWPFRRTFAMFVPQPVSINYYMTDQEQHPDAYEKFRDALQDHMRRYMNRSRLHEPLTFT